MTPHLLVVDPNRPGLLATLQEQLNADAEVAVIVDRRRDDRRQVRKAIRPDRRRGERRRVPPDTWTTFGFVLVSHGEA